MEFLPCVFDVLARQKERDEPDVCAICQSTVTARLVYRSDDEKHRHTRFHLALLQQGDVISNYDYWELWQACFPMSPLSDDHYQQPVVELGGSLGSVGAGGSVSSWTPTSGSIQTTDGDDRHPTAGFRYEAVTPDGSLADMLRSHDDQSMTSSKGRKGGKRRKHVLYMGLDPCESGGPVYQCELCPASSKRQWDIWRHQLSHSKERPYICDVCSEGFREKNKLAYHCTDHTPIEELLVDLGAFKCFVCVTYFNTREALLHHRARSGHILLKGDGTYKCDLCLEKFTAKRELKSHKRRTHVMDAV